MRVLLDSHALIWYVDHDHLVPPIAYATIANPANELLVSAATIWEVAIKVGTGKLTLAGPYRPWITKAISDLGATILPISVEYADYQAGLPFHHRDPFDRLLIAQSLVENIPVVSRDSQFDAYGIVRIW